MAGARTVTYGGDKVDVQAEDDRRLLDVLRAELKVRSAAKGCSDGTCGACRVMVDGALVASCRATWGEVREGATIETHEVLEGDPAADRAVNAFASERPTRCRLCVGALAVTAAFLARRRDGERKSEAIDEALARATCMCTGRGSLRRALAKSW
jgi:aerobic-type carbon monoxide dehydrogenase small subunit (CoxS/CutS family)